MSENAITFSELRKIQKEERRSEELKELDDNFFIKVGDYLQRKKDTSDGREYKNAKRVFRKILSLREDKIVKNARLSLKSNIKASELNMLPREQELFRRMKQEFNQHRDKIQDVTDEHRGKSIEDEIEKPEIDEQVESSEDSIEDNSSEDEEEENSEDEFNPEEGYEIVEITSEVPEFMGTDLEAYGPFEEGEQAEIPEDNAEILINRGNAEQLS